jgi:hypothetical protein
VVRVVVSDDAERVPLRIETNMPMAGTITMTLESANHPPVVAGLWGKRPQPHWQSRYPISGRTLQQFPFAAVTLVSPSSQGDTMKAFRFLPVVLAAVVTAGAGHEAAGPEVLRLQPGSKVWVSGGSTVRDWRCDAKTVESALVPGTQDPATADLEQLVQTGKVVVPVADLECGNGKMNDHMRKALKADDNPAIEFTMVSYELRGTQALLRGRLGIAGAQQDIEIPATVTQEDGGVVRVKGETEIRMTKWGIKPPSLMLGTMKVKDPVTIGFDVTVER